MTRALPLLIALLLLAGIIALAIPLWRIAVAVERINTRSAYEADSLRRDAAEGWARADIWRTRDSLDVENRARDILRQRADRAKRLKTKGGKG